MLIVTSFLVVMIGFPYLAFLPRVADSIFDQGAAGYGMMSAMSAVGAVVHVAVRGRPRRRRSRPTHPDLPPGSPSAAVSCCWQRHRTSPSALVVVLLVGAAAAGFQSMNNSLVLALSDFEYHGRIQSLMLLSFSGFGMAALPLGHLADRIGLRQTLAGMGVLTIACMTGYWLARRPGLRRRADIAFG